MAKNCFQCKNDFLKNQKAPEEKSLLRLFGKGGALVFEPPIPNTN